MTSRRSGSRTLSARPVQVAPSSKSRARTRPGFSSDPRWWMERIAKLRWKSRSTARRRSAGSKPGFHSNEP